MSSVHSENTSPERVLRSGLWHRGFRYRINDKRLPGSPDIVLPKYRSVIFVHGCFWHGHKGCKYYTVPKTNTDFWVAKVARNRERDQKNWRQLEAKGWHVIVVWACQLKKANLDNAIVSIIAELKTNREKYETEQDERKKARKRYLLSQKVIKEKERAILHEIKRS